MLYSARKNCFWNLCLLPLSRSVKARILPYVRCFETCFRKLSEVIIVPSLQARTERVQNKITFLDGKINNLAFSHQLQSLQSWHWMKKINKKKQTPVDFCKEAQTNWVKRSTEKGIQLLSLISFSCHFQERYITFCAFLGLFHKKLLWEVYFFLFTRYFHVAIWVRYPGQRILTALKMLLVTVQDIGS